MGAWHYAYFFPGPDRPLNTGNAIASLESNGFEVTSGTKRLEERLRNGEQFSLGIGKQDTASDGKETIRTTFACDFDLKSSNPHFSFGWHRGLFARLPDVTQWWYWQTIRDAAQAANAHYVVLGVEPPEGFEDRFIEIDGKRILDTQTDDPWATGVWAVWVDRSAGGECPEGVPDTDPAEMGKGFLWYSVN